MIRLARTATLAVVLFGLTGCGLPPLLSDTGYEGTWSRGNAWNVSILAIKKTGDTWRFRWTKRAFNGRLTILCDWDGRCEEYLDNRLAAHYTILARMEADGKLYTDTVEDRTLPQVMTLRYTDVMEVTDGGRTLWNYTLERDGERFEGMARPMRSFTKVSNAIVEPPGEPPR